MDRSLRVLILGDAESPHVQRWSQELQKRNMETRVLSFNPKTQAKNGIWIGKFNPWSLPFTILKARKEMQKFSPNVIHAHFASSYGVFGALIAGNKPLVISVWGSDVLVTAQKNWIFKSLVSWALRKATKVFTDSKDLIRACEKLAPHNPPQLIQWGVDLEKIPQRSDEAGRPFTFISTRLHEPIYRVDQIIKGFLTALKSNPHLHLHILGRGSLNARLRQLAAPAQEKIEFHDFLPELEVLKLLSKSDCAISVPTTDGTAMSVLEAMACGLPLICSDLPANREWLDENENIFLNEVSESTLSDAMLKMAARKVGGQAKSRHPELIAKNANRKLEFNKVSEVYQSLSRN